MSTDKAEKFHYELPSDVEAEKALLGMILLNSKVMEEVADILKPYYFYDKRNEVVYSLMIKLWSESKPIDNLFLLDALKFQPNVSEQEKNSIHNDYLLELISKSSLSSSAGYTAEIIKKKHILRSLIQASDKIKSLAVTGGNEITSLMEESQKMIYDISLDNIDKNFTPLNEILLETYERIDRLHNEKVEYRGIPTGFADLDNILGGLQKSDLIILAARPSMGKTSLALEIVKRVAINSGDGVAFFSLEMSRDQLCDKMISSVSGIELRKIRSGHLSDDQSNNEFMRLGVAIGQLEQAPVWIDDSGSLNILELRTKARRLKSRHNIGLIVIDYLQLMSGVSAKNYGGSRVLEVSEISRGLKMLAKELDVPILALSQLSRSVEGRDDKRPMLSDLRESGSIEQDADIVMFVHREEMYHRETKKKGIADIIISKHRNGETGQVELAWLGRLATFENLDHARIRRRTTE
jgi:replicative DNA helicase